MGLGLSPTLLTGDRPERARRVGEALGIPWRASMLPADKVRAVREEHGADGSAMVGDGVNDAPVLAAADVGIALGSASDLTARAGNVRLASDRLDRLPVVICLSRHAHARIRTCLAWTFAFNGAGVGLAAAGLLGPVFAAVAMLVSSLTVILLASGAGKPVEAADPALGGARSTPRSTGLTTAAPAGG